jgi:hypothetical protein
MQALPREGRTAMTPDDRAKCETFVRSLNLLHVDGDGLTDATDFDDIKAIAQVCPMIKEITAAGETPEQVVLHQLAILTERVCLTWGIANREAVKQWLIARGELLVLQIGMV